MQTVALASPPSWRYFQQLPLPFGWIFCVLIALLNCCWSQCWGRGKSLSDCVSIFLAILYMVCLFLCGTCSVALSSASGGRAL